MENITVMIVIHGGNNQILPNATHAIHNTYYDGEKVHTETKAIENEPGNVVIHHPAEQELEIPQELQSLYIYE